MSPEDHKVTSRRLAEVFNKCDLTFIEKSFSPHFVLHPALALDWPRGLEGARQMITTMLIAGTAVVQRPNEIPRTSSFLRYQRRHVRV